MKRVSRILCSILVWSAVCMVTQAQSFAQVAVKEEVYKEDKIIAKFPQFTGIKDDYVQRKINMDIKVAVGQFIDQNRKNENNKEVNIAYKIHYMDEKKASFEIEMYAYNGGAHGMTDLTGYTYNLETGQLYSLLQLFDFKPSEINQKIFAHAKEKEIFLFSDFKGITVYPQNFYLNENGRPVLLFQQYEIAPYSSGILKVEM